MITPDVPPSEADHFGRRQIVFTYPNIGPSDNHIMQIRYIYKGARKVPVLMYTAKATAYKKELASYIGNYYALPLQEFLQGHTPQSLYRLDVVLLFLAEDVINKGYAKNSAQNPYKKLDTLNRRKLLEDAVATAVGFDDSLFWDENFSKMITEDTRGLVITITEVDPQTFGVPLSMIWRPDDKQDRAG